MDTPNHFGLWMTLNKVSQTYKEEDIQVGVGKSGVFNIFGYYDLLSFLDVKSYQDFSPATSRSKGYKLVGSNNSIISSFDIRATVPTFLMSEDLAVNPFSEDPFFDYDIYSKSKKYKAKPLVSLIVLHYHYHADNKKIEDFNDATKRVMEIISDHNKDIPKKTDKALYAVYNSLGTMDAVVLCRASNYYTTFDLLNKLKTEPNLLSGSYIIPAIQENADKKSLKAWRDCEYDNNIGLSLRVTLNVGHTYESFMSEFSDYLDSMLSGYLSDNNATLNDVITYDNMSGVTDLSVRADNIPIAWFGEMYADRGNPFLSSVCNSVQNVRTEVIVRNVIENNNNDYNPTSWLDGENPPKSRDDIEKQITERLKYELSKHEEFARDRNTTFSGSNRVYNGMMEFLNNCFDLTRKPESADLCHMLDKFLFGIAQMLQNVRELYENSYEDTKTRLLKHSHDSLNQLRNILYEVVSDYSRGNQSWVEGRSFIHQSMGTSKKIISIFNALAVELVEKLAAKDNDYFVLIRSGGTDKARVKRLFHLIRSNPRGNEHRMDIVNLPEKDLFDFNYNSTLFVFVHELLHGIPTDARCRKEREEFYIGFVISLIAMKLSTDLLYNDVKIIFDVKNNLSKEVQQKLHRSFRVGIINAIKGTVMEHYKLEQEKKGNLLYLESVKNSLIFALKIAFDPYVRTQTASVLKDDGTQTIPRIKVCESKLVQSIGAVSGFRLFVQNLLSRQILKPHVLPAQKKPFLPSCTCKPQRGQLPSGLLVGAMSENSA
ncbi:MAG: hypothetical protein FWC20_11985 [Oscillospiraceae bacterium]|nr:hypothetical protein [Oscillospiraceae bacterium]MCL2280104.1 hypothetical protein [Oscillospiraceae bacterium]